MVTSASAVPPQLPNAGPNPTLCVTLPTRSDVITEMLGSGKN